MTENVIPVNPNLADHIELEIQQKGTVAVQLELGVLKSTVLMQEARINALMSQRVFDLQLIEALKARAFSAENINKTFADEIRQMKQKRKKVE